MLGGNGFSVALVARTQETLDGLTAPLREAGIEAAVFAADVTGRPSPVAAFTPSRSGSAKSTYWSTRPRRRRSPTPSLAAQPDTGCPGSRVVRSDAAVAHRPQRISPNPAV
ncbi:hypothetical protein OH767_04900 [Streptomyces sp. NBC_01614]